MEGCVIINPFGHFFPFISEPFLVTYAWKGLKRPFNLFVIQQTATYSLFW